MKTILICPNETNGITILSEKSPVASLPLLGEGFLGYWLEHLSAKGVKEVRLVTTEDPESIQRSLGNGTRWGVTLEIFPEVRELTAAEARKRYRPAYEEDWYSEDVIEADHLPGLPEHKVYASYANWFQALALWMPHVTASKRIGMREIAPGVWAGRKLKLGKNVRFKGPCWIGDHVRIGNDSVVGPLAFLEDKVVIDQAVEIGNSWVGPDTFVGSLTHVHESLAWGSLLINWKSGSHIIVPDSFLMSSLSNDEWHAPKSRRKRSSEAASPSPLARPIEAVISLAQKIQS